MLKSDADCIWICLEVVYFVLVNKCINSKISNNLKDCVKNTEMNAFILRTWFFIMSMAGFEPFISIICNAWVCLSNDENMNPQMGNKWNKAATTTV